MLNHAGFFSNSEAYAYYLVATEKKPKFYPKRMKVFSLISIYLNCEIVTVINLDWLTPASLTRHLSALDVCDSPV